MELMKVYADPITVNCRKVLAGLDLIGAPYEHVHVDYFTGQHKGDEYMALNPNASVPALVDGDLVLWESNAILMYAADKVGNHAAYPTDLKVRADINRWLLWESSSWFGSCYVYLVEHCVKPLLAAEPDPQVIAAQDATWNKLAAILNARLARQVPASVRTICVDSDADSVIKLMDRGSHQAFGLVTDCEFFLKELAAQLKED